MLKGIYLYVRSHGVKLTFDDFAVPLLPPPLPPFLWKFPI